jgi:hypothetical protein
MTFAEVIGEHDPSRTHSVTGSILLGSVVIVVLSLIGIWIVVYIARHFDEPGDGGEGRDGGGGKSPNPRAPGPSSEPDWWPEFERQFAAYLGRHPTPSRRRGRPRHPPRAPIE